LLDRNSDSFFDKSTLPAWGANEVEAIFAEGWSFKHKTNDDRHKGRKDPGSHRLLQAEQNDEESLKTD
jgi:hypothetical protein